jgi:O-antigen/teichoic acid export membrane protein
MIFFGKNLLLLWTGNALLTENVAPLLVLLALGTMLNGLMHIPFLLTLAYGWTRFGVYLNIISVLLLVPSVIWATVRYGAMGAASIWVILNVGYVLISTHFLYRRLLITEKWRWYGKDLLLPMLATILITWLCLLLQPAVENKLVWLAWLSVTGILMIISAWITSSELSNLHKLLK